MLRFPEKRDAEGVLRISGLTEGKYKVVVGAPGHSRARHEVEAAKGKPVEISDVLYEAGNLTWTLVNGQTGRQLSFSKSKIRFDLVPRSESVLEIPRTEEQSYGEWGVQGLMPGDYRGTARLPDGRMISHDFTIYAGQLVQESTPVDGIRGE
jgi:hypothetical protein